MAEESIAAGRLDDGIRSSLTVFRLARLRALRQMLFYLIGAMVLGIVLYALAGTSFWVFLTVALLIAWTILWRRTVGAARKQLDRSVLKAAAEREGAQFVPEAFDPPVWPKLAPLLVRNPSRVQRRFINLLRIGTSESPRCLIYDADIREVVGFGKGRRVSFRFEGQFYQFPRRSDGRGTTVLVPQGHPTKHASTHYERVPLDDSAMRRVFDAYSTDAAEARELLASSQLRDELLELAKGARKHRVFALLEPSISLVAVDGVTTPAPKARLRDQAAAAIQRASDYLRHVSATAKRLAAALP